MATVHYAFLLIFIMGCRDAASQAFSTVTNGCMGCICEGASLCNVTLDCDEGLCGMFRISQPYWVDAGKFVLAGDDVNDPKTWTRCVKDTYCAGRTVNSYITKFKQDCNGDGVINCKDYGLIHHLGGYGCSSGRKPDALFSRQFERCLVDVPDAN